MPRVKSEYEVETLFIDRLQDIGYEYVELANYDDVVANAPIGISEYELTNLLPDDFKSTLPSIEEIEEELKSKDD